MRMCIKYCQDTKIQIKHLMFINQDQLSLLFIFNICWKAILIVFLSLLILNNTVDVRISDIWAVRFVRSFRYTINVWNPNVQLVESINRTSKIWTKWFVFQTLSEIQTIWEWDKFGKRRNPNIPISDVYCSRYHFKLFLFRKVVNKDYPCYFPRSCQLQKKIVSKACF